MPAVALDSITASLGTVVVPLGTGVVEPGGPEPGGPKRDNLCDPRRLKRNAEPLTLPRIVSSTPRTTSTVSLRVAPLRHSSGMSGAAYVPRAIAWPGRTSFVVEGGHLFASLATRADGEHVVPSHAQRPSSQHSSEFVRALHALPPRRVRDEAKRIDSTETLLLLLGENDGVFVDAQKSFASAYALRIAEGFAIA